MISDKDEYLKAEGGSSEGQKAYVTSYLVRNFRFKLFVWQLLSIDSKFRYTNESAIDSVYKPIHSDSD